MSFSSTQEIEKELFALADKEYAAFDARLTNTRYPLIGVRKPQLIALARRIVKGDHRTFLAQPFTYFEHHLLRGAVSALCKASEEEHVRLFYDYVGYIDDWEACDLTACRYNAATESYYAAMCALLHDEREFAVRFGLVALMHNFAGRAERSARLVQDVKSLSHQGYYVKMAAAWLLSAVWLADKAPVLAFLQDPEQDRQTRLTAIGKLLDSYRVRAEDKPMLRALRGRIRAE